MYCHFWVSQDGIDFDNFSSRNNGERSTCSKHFQHFNIDILFSNSNYLLSYIHRNAKLLGPISLHRYH
jgi:hypothetical protein